MTLDELCIEIQMHGCGCSSNCYNIAQLKDNRDIDNVIINYMCSTKMPLEEIRNFCNFFKMANESYLSKKPLSKCQWWRYCQTMDRPDILEELLDAGFKIVTEGNIVRQFVYAGKLDMAKILLDHDYSAPATINLFQISSQLSWKLDRLKFLYDSGTVLEITDEEQKVMQYILNNII